MTNSKNNNKEKIIHVFENWYEQERHMFRSLYTYFHEHPELAFQERKTSDRLIELLREFGFSITSDLGKTGFVGENKNGDGPSLMYRSEMDGLPLTERNDVPFASRARAKNLKGIETGVMHACGHDLHMTIMLGIARFLSLNTNLWKGSFYCLGQPAEEIGSGARAMIKDGLFNRIGDIDYLLAIHLLPTLASGELGIKQGAVMPGVRNLRIVFFGKGAHAGEPYYGKNPVVIAAKAILKYREMIAALPKDNNGEAALISVGSIHSGNVFNIVPDKAVLELSVRAFSDDILDRVINKIRYLSIEEAKNAGLSDDMMPEVVVSANIRTEVTVNDPELTTILHKYISEVIKKDNVKLIEPLMIGDDFCQYSKANENIKSSMVFLGVTEAEKIRQYRKQKKQIPFLLESDFLPDFEKSFYFGVKTMVYSICNLLIT
ncbi:MAG: M20 family metallopeptidase [Bacteroidales bacterium]